MVSETLPRKIYNFSIKHWIYSGLILSLPTYYFLFIQLFGRNLGLINSNGIITETGLFIFWPFFIVLFLTSFAKTLSDKYNEKVMFNGQYVLRKLLSSTNSLKQTKTRRFVNYITDHHGQTDLDPFQNITNPILQIELLLENIRETLADISDIDSDNIGISILYKTDIKPRWKWLHSINTPNDLSKSELISTSSTSARQIIDGKKNSVFYADKHNGERNREYYPSQKDNECGGIGSVICRDISIANEADYLTAIMSITTYGQQICATNDNDTKYRIENIILPCFENRIKLELSLLYIRHMVNV